jgi:endoglycosylceramidase
MASNMGIYSAIEPLLGPDGKRDPKQAYAPHGYDLVTDTPDVDSPCNARVELIFQRHAETAKRLGMPMLAGEWGAYGGSAKAEPAARFVAELFERIRCGDTYWAYGRNMANEPAFGALKRGLPHVVAGTLLEYHADADKGTFVCAWKEDGKASAPTRIYLPESFQVAKERVKLSPAEKGFGVEPVQEGSGSVYVTVPPSGKEMERRLEVLPR